MEKSQQTAENKSAVLNLTDTNLLQRLFFVENKLGDSLNQLKVKQLHTVTTALLFFERS